jgi:disulfide bond formation protein DsbB
MMLAIFATLSLALITAYRGRRRCAACLALACLGLSIALFLFEIPYAVAAGATGCGPAGLVARPFMSTATGDRLPATLNDLFQFAMMAIIAAILTTAMVLQYYGGEIPCPLCLLQRVAMFGVCFGIILHFRHGYSARHDGISMLSALLLLIISARQTLLDIAPRPGHGYIGSAVFGLHMPVWSVIIALAILLAFALKFAVLGGDDLRDSQPSPMLCRLGRLLGLYMIALCLINLVSVLLQCGAGACHTNAYRLLGG